MAEPVSSECWVVLLHVFLGHDLTGEQIQTSRKLDALGLKRLLGPRLALEMTLG